MGCKMNCCANNVDLGAEKKLDPKTNIKKKRNLRINSINTLSGKNVSLFTPQNDKLVSKLAINEEEEKQGNDQKKKEEELKADIKNVKTIQTGEGDGGKLKFFANLKSRKGKNAYGLQRTSFFGILTKFIEKQDDAYTHGLLDDENSNREKQNLKFRLHNNYSETDSHELMKILSSLYFIKNMDNSTIKEIIHNMKLCFVEEGQIVHEKGIAGYYLFIIKTGSVSFYDEDPNTEPSKKEENKDKKNNEVESSSNRLKKIGTLKSWEYFGELALVQTEFRKFKAVCDVETTFWVLGKLEFKNAVSNFNESNIEQISNFLDTVTFFKNFDKEVKAIICRCLIMNDYEKDTTILKEGESGNTMYIIKEGQVKCLEGDRVVRTLGPGEIFGERSILTDSKRSLDVITSTKTLCYSLSKNTLSSALGTNYKKALFNQFIQFALQNSPKFKGLRKKYIDIISEIFKEKNYSNQEVVYAKGSIKSDKMIIIVIGGLGYKKDGVNITEYVKGTTLLYRGDFDKMTEQYDLLAYPDCLLVEAEEEDIKTELGKLGMNSLDKAVEKSNDFSILESNKILRKLPRPKIEELFDSTAPKNYQKGEEIYQKDKFIYFIISGEVEFMKATNKPNTPMKKKTQRRLFQTGTVGSGGSSYKDSKKINSNKNLNKNTNADEEKALTPEEEFKNKYPDKEIDKKTLGKGEMLGTNILFNGEYGDELAIASSDEVRCLLLSENNINNKIKKQLLDYLKEEIQINDSMKFNLTDLEIYDELYPDQYGYYSLVKPKGGDVFFSILRVDKKMIIVKDLFDKMLRKKEVLSNLDSPFTPKLLKTFQDSRYIFFVEKFVNGTDFLKFLYSEERENLSKNETFRFIFGCLLIGLSILHSKKIIYRSLIPENIKINEEGYLILSEIPYAKLIKDKSNRTKTIINKYANYMAPEVILGEDYSFDVDIWSLGIIMYEFIFGITPFSDPTDKERCNDPMTIYFNIINGKLNFPNNHLDRNFTDLLLNILQKNQESRLTKIEDIKNHPWFADWNKENKWKKVEYLEEDSQLKLTNEYIFSNKSKGSYSRYLIENFEEWKPSKQISERAEDKKKYEELFANFNDTTNTSNNFDE